MNMAFGGGGSFPCNKYDQCSTKNNLIEIVNFAPSIILVAVNC